VNVADDSRDAIRVAAWRRLDSLTKPRGSLGRLEILAADLCAMQRTLSPDVEHAELLLFAADHGLADAGVSAYPRAVTAQMITNFLAGGAAASVLARQFGCGLRVIDVGVDAELPLSPALERASVARGTRNTLEQDAMSAAQCAAAFEVGAAAARATVARGTRLVLLGEMGIGNTSAAALLLAGLTGWPLARCVGPGTGLDDDGLRHKLAVLERVWDRATRQGPWSNETSLRAAQLQQRFGGFEIAALAGAAATAASLHAAVLVDGFTVTVAAALAERISPGTLAQCVFSHRSAETAHRDLLDWLGVEPLLDLRLRLGEGSGALLALPLLRSAAAILAGMATFEEAGVSVSRSASV
jgi:nicotinate-nucleotide--dimethylbenzimidazole phosphoribosyltransferase